MKKLFSRMSSMCDEAYFLIRCSVILTATLFACSVLIIVAAGRFSTDTYRLYLLAEELYRLPQAILLIAAVGSVILEDMFSGAR